MIYFVAVPIFSKTQVNITGGTFDTALVPVLLSGKLFSRTFAQTKQSLLNATHSGK